MRGKYLETTDEKCVCPVRVARRMDAAGSDEEVVSLHGSASTDRGIPRVTVRADTGHGTVTAVTKTGGRVVACRGGVSSHFFS